MKDNSVVAKIIEHADETEVLLNHGVDPQSFLKRLIENGALISKFEKVEPSLNDIFIEKVSE